MVLGRVNIACYPPRTGEVYPLFWLEPSYEHIQLLRMGVFVFRDCRKS